MTDIIDRLNSNEWCDATDDAIKEIKSLRAQLAAECEVSNSYRTERDALKSERDLTRSTVTVLQERNGSLEETIRGICEAEDEALRWVPITQKFPPHDVEVVFAIALPGGYWDAQTGKRVNYDDVPMFWNETMKRQITHATHWLELPEPPEGETTP